MRLQQICRQQGRGQPRGQQRRQDGGGHGDAELAEILPHHAADKAHGQEHGDDGSRNCHHGETDGVGGVDGGQKRAFARCQMVFDVFDFDNRIVHQNTDDQGQTEQGNVVERVVEGIHHYKGGQDGQGQRHRRYQSGTPVA